MTQTALQVAQSNTMLESYNPREHLVKWTAFDKAKGKSVVVEYYPAAWRLYELRLRYPSITIETEVVAMDIERDFVLIKAWMFTGPTYAESVGLGHKRASSAKQGKLSMYDRVETAAKSRAARDMGISTELALDMDDGEIEGSVTVIEEERANGHVIEAGNAPRALPQPQQEAFDPKKALDKLYDRAMEIGIITDLVGWQSLKCDVFGEMVSDEKITEKAQCEQIRVEIVKRKEARKVPAEIAS